MPQNNDPVITVRPVNLPQLNVTTVGGIAVVGNPGGPVVFTNHGSAMIPALAGIARNVSQ